MLAVFRMDPRDFLEVCVAVLAHPEDRLQIYPEDPVPFFFFSQVKRS
jgi:hypothetical protein